MTKREKLCYIAGVCDGESSLYISKTKKNNKNQYRACISIAMNDVFSLRVIQDMWGGNINVGTKKVDLETKKVYSPAYVLSYGSESKVKQIIKDLYPYLQVKKEQAQLIYMFLLHKEDVRIGKVSKFVGGGIMNNLYIKCKKLKSKNWIIKK